MVVLPQLVLDQFIKTCKPINDSDVNHSKANFFSATPIIPTIDLNNPDANSLLVKACKEFGFFKVVNHGISMQIMSQLEDEARKFFSLPQLQKESAGIPNPFGYGNKKIGQNGDVGWIEYLLLSTSSDYISQISLSIFPDNPDIFRHAIVNYISKMKKMAVHVLEMIAEGLNIKEDDKNELTKLIEDEKSDSYFRLNHYPPKPESFEALNGRNLVGFGEHTDPQIISVLRSNKIGGLQISLKDGSWVSVPPDDNSFFILVGDSLQ
ncbi:Gibberellin 2-beta-dioxygenase, partial [Bienertia sinuspersici]